MQLGVVISVVLILVICIIMNAWNEKQKRVKYRDWLKQIYGKKPEVKQGYELQDEEAIAIYWDSIKKEIPEDEIIDEITWNDLEMNRVFGRLNTTQSFMGEQILFSQLHRISKDKMDLIGLEPKLTFYSDYSEERENTQLLLGKLKKDRKNYYIPMFVNVLEMQKIPLIWVYRVLQCTLILSLYLAVVFANPLAIGAAAIHFLINIVLYAVGKSKYEVYMDTITGIVNTIKISKVLVHKYEANHIEVTEYIKEDLKQLHSISKILGSMESKKQSVLTGDLTALVTDYLMGALMWDFIKYDKVIKELTGKRKAFMELYQFLGEADMCIAITSFRKSLAGYCIPAFGEHGLSVEEIYHPLIDTPVTNNLDMKKSILLTGSNASGKSTFVKAVAINCILGQSIHTCTAKHMLIPNVRVLTSMAIRDDVLSGESYYIKEIKYLKRMIEKSNDERMILCGVDEILRGTNTTERVAASIAILHYLYHKNCLILVASHDLELAKELENKYDNYYFCETLKDKDVIFDYKLRKGISNSHNAIQLLQSVGFPEEIVQEAISLSTILPLKSKNLGAV